MCDYITQNFLEQDTTEKLQKQVLLEQYRVFEMLEVSREVGRKIEDRKFWCTVVSDHVP